MGTQLIRVAFATLLISLTSLNHVIADTFEKADGEVLEGAIEYSNENEVTIKNSGGEYVTASIASFSESSALVIQKWIEAHPELSGVYSVWDVKPSVVRSRVAVTPPQLNEPGFKGLVSVQVILDETGKVSSASVSKSTHQALEGPAIEAIRKWSFKPAQVAGQSVKARIAISFKFEA